MSKGHNITRHPRLSVASRAALDEAHEAEEALDQAFVERLRQLCPRPVLSPDEARQLEISLLKRTARPTVRRVSIEARAPWT